MDKKKAGSHSGICLLHLLWKLPFVEAHGKLEGIACPLELLCTIPADKGQGVHLFHYERDLLCCWQPTIDFIQCAPSRLRRDRLRFTSAVSHQDQWWSNHTHNPILSPLLSPAPPRHEYTLNGTWRRHHDLPCGLSLQVYTQYPRPEAFMMTSSFFCMRSPL